MLWPFPLTGPKMKGWGQHGPGSSCPPTEEEGLHRISEVHLHGHEGQERNWMQEDKHWLKQAVKVYIRRCWMIKVLQGSQDRSAGDCKMAKLLKVFPRVPNRLVITTHGNRAEEPTSPVILTCLQLGFYSFYYSVNSSTRPLATQKKAYRRRTSSPITTQTNKKKSKRRISS